MAAGHVQHLGKGKIYDCILIAFLIIAKFRIFQNHIILNFLNIF